jgi:hypothetical protein
MPSLKPRVSVVLEQEDFDVISEYCELAGVSRSKFLADTARGARPMLLKLIKLMAVAKNMDEHSKQVAEFALNDARFGLISVERDLNIEINQLLEFDPTTDAHAHAVSLPAAAEACGAVDSVAPSINKGVRFSEKEPESEEKSNIYSILEKMNKGV